MSPSSVRHPLDFGVRWSCLIGLYANLLCANILIGFFDGNRCLAASTVDTMPPVDMVTGVTADAGTKNDVTDTTISAINKGSTPNGNGITGAGNGGRGTGGGGSTFVGNGGGSGSDVGTTAISGRGVGNDEYSASEGGEQTTAGSGGNGSGGNGSGGNGSGGNGSGGNVSGSNTTKIGNGVSGSGNAVTTVPSGVTYGGGPNGNGSRGGGGGLGGGSGNETWSGNGTTIKTGDWAGNYGNQTTNDYFENSTWTQPPNLNGTNITVFYNTSTMRRCFKCQSKQCDNVTTANTCYSPSGNCYAYYDAEITAISLGCFPLVPLTYNNCNGEYLSAATFCEYCCQTGDYCNYNHKLPQALGVWCSVATDVISGHIGASLTYLAAILVLCIKLF